MSSTGDAARSQSPVPGWPQEVREVRYASAADSSEECALYYAPGTEEPAPLLVGLHNWSGDYRQVGGAAYATWCIERGWVFVHPNFRGPNWRPDATGSELVVGDILSAVEYARRSARVDESRIYLVGASGGGYTALLMAGRAPEVWAGVSAWVSISDLKAWYSECMASGRAYAEHIVKSCGGVPGAGAEVDAAYERRSPLTHLGGAANVPLDINAGITDGHTGSVPVSHSLRAFNTLAGEDERLSDDEIGYFVREMKVPPHLVEPVDDPSYGEHVPLFRRSAGRTRVTIFEGGHEIVPGAALSWLASQRKP